MFVCSSVYFFIDQLTGFLFTHDFELIKEPLIFQLLGDVFKISSWLISYLMFSKGMVKTFVVSEVAFSVSFCVFTVIFVQIFGFRGVGIAHLCNYVLYLLFAYIFVYRKLHTLEGHYFEKL